MAALWGLVVIAFAMVSQYIGVTTVFRFSGAIYREQDPVGFKKAIGVNVVIGLLFIVGWFINYYWPSIFD